MRGYRATRKMRVLPMREWEVATRALDDGKIESHKSDRRILENQTSAWKSVNLSVKVFHRYQFMIVTERTDFDVQARQQLRPRLTQPSISQNLAVTTPLH
jgi:hypothetical protein